MHGAETLKEHEGPRHAGARAEVLEARGGRQSVTNKAKGDTLSRTSGHTTLPAFGASRLAAGRGRATPVLPDLSKCKGSLFPIPEECPACSNWLGQLTPCRDWPS